MQEIKEKTGSLGLSRNYAYSNAFSGLQWPPEPVIVT